MIGKAREVHSHVHVRGSAPIATEIGFTQDGVAIASIFDDDGGGTGRTAMHVDRGVRIEHLARDAAAIRGAGAVNNLVELEAIDGNSVIRRTLSQKPRLIGERDGWNC